MSLHDNGIFLMQLVSLFIFSGYHIKMKAFLVALMLAAAAAVSALPTKSKLSQEELRASLITKDNVAEYLQSQRHKKAMQQQKVPEPFVISTSLNVGR